MRDASVRQLAVTVLSRLVLEAWRVRLRLAASDPSEGVRRAAEIALRRMGRGLDAVQPPDAP
jgi:hypothetical protein